MREYDEAGVELVHVRPTPRILAAVVGAERVPAGHLLELTFFAILNETLLQLSAAPPHASALDGTTIPQSSGSELYSFIQISSGHIFSRLHPHLCRPFDRTGELRFEQLDAR